MKSWLPGIKFLRNDLLRQMMGSVEKTRDVQFCIINPGTEQRWNNLSQDSGLQLYLYIRVLPRIIAIRMTIHSLNFLIDINHSTREDRRQDRAIYLTLSMMLMVLCVDVLTISITRVVGVLGSYW